MPTKMTSAIKQIRLNDATFSNTVIEPTFINFFYGKNGVGKSTIACAVKDESNLQWDAGTSVLDYDVLVYDTTFIKENFANYDNLPGVFTINETNIAVQKELEQLKAERKQKREEYLNYKKSITEKTLGKEQAMTTFQTTCWKKVEQLRKIFDAPITGKKKPALFAQEILVINPRKHDFEELRKLCETAYSKEAQIYQELSKPQDTTFQSLSGYGLVGKIISSSSETDFSKFVKALKATDWVRDGHSHYSENNNGKCPYCQQPLPANFDDEIAACFDEIYQNEISDVIEFQKTFSKEMDSVLSTLNTNIDIAMPGIDLEEYKTKLQSLADAITIDKQRIAAKVKEPSKIVALQEIDTLITEMNAIIDSLNEKIRGNNDIVNDIKTQKIKCKKNIWEYLADFLGNEVKSYNNTVAALDKEIKQLKIDMDKLTSLGFSLAQKINELNKKTINTESTIESINNILSHSGFQGFSLHSKENVPNTYEVIRYDGTVAENLSEGERNFIAFLYFYNIVRGSLNSAEVKEKIVVIDDPVSSLDSSALFIVSALVREMIEVCNNNTDYLNQRIVGDYIKQIFILTHNVYFHKEITYHHENQYRSVNFYVIRKTENISSLKLCVRQSQSEPTNMENYNPIQNSYAALWDEYKELKTVNTITNVIRRILEYYFIQLCGDLPPFYVPRETVVFPSYC
jgi:wobble nucleotide-excising tRNase